MKSVTNKTVVLVNEWAVFEQDHPEGSIEEFCRAYLINRSSSKVKGDVAGGVIPPVKKGLLLKIVGRIGRLSWLFGNLAFNGFIIQSFEEFGILATLLLKGETSKSEVITANLIEVSSGMDILARLEEKKLIRISRDKTDKRTKRLKLTSKGEKAVKEGGRRMTNLSEMLLHHLSEEEITLCTQLLQIVDIEFSQVWLKNKGKSFDHIFDELMKTEKF